MQKAILRFHLNWAWWFIPATSAEQEVCIGGTKSKARPGQKLKMLLGKTKQKGLRVSLRW
jgi:hypothetical protein